MSTAVPTAVLLAMGPSWGLRSALVLLYEGARRKPAWRLGHETEDITGAAVCQCLCGESSCGFLNQSLHCEPVALGVACCPALSEDAVGASE